MDNFIQVVHDHNVVRSNRLSAVTPFNHKEEFGVLSKHHDHWGRAYLFKDQQLILSS